MAEHLAMDKSRTAIVVIDLQKGIASKPTKPHTNAEVISNSAKLVNAFRQSGMPVFLVHVVPSPGAVLMPIADVTMPLPSGPIPADTFDFVPELAPEKSDIVITKRGASAFHGTELDLQLRRRKLDTIVLCGIATDYGVESTARFAYEYGYQQIFAEDAMASFSDEQHNAAVNYVFRQMGRVRKTADIIEAIH